MSEAKTFVAFGIWGRPYHNKGEEKPLWLIMSEIGYWSDNSFSSSTTKGALEGLLAKFEDYEEKPDVLIVESNDVYGPHQHSFRNPFARGHIRSHKEYRVVSKKALTFCAYIGDQVVTDLDDSPTVYEVKCQRVNPTFSKSIQTRYYSEDGRRQDIKQDECVI